MLELLQPIWHTLQLLVVIFLGFSISVDSCHEFPRADESSLAFSFLLVAGFSVSVTVSYDEDVGEVDEVEELADKPSATNGA